MNKFVLAGLALALLPIHSASALDRVGLELGYGVGTKMARVTGDWDWNRQWNVGQNWTASGSWEAGVGSWHSDRTGGRTLWEVGFTPVMRLNSRHSGFFWEGGIGVHLMSENRINDSRIFGNHFNFGEHLGFGWHLGDHGRYELGYRIEHLSNGDTTMPNDGINFQQIRLGYNF